MILQILDNILLLTLVGMSYYGIEGLRRGKSRSSINVLHGFGFGFIAFLVTSTPVEMVNEATVDARAGPVILAGVVAGPFGALIAGVLGGLARGLVGGSFALSGMIVYGVYAAIGIAFWALAAVKPNDLMKPTKVFLLIISSVLGASAMFFLIQPTSLAVEWLQQDLPLIAVANSLSVAYTAAMIAIALGLLRRNEKLHEFNETLRIAKHAGGFGVWDFDIQTGKLIWDDRSKELHGIADVEFGGTFEDWSRNVHHDDLANAQDAFSRSVSEGRPFEQEYRVKLPGGGQKVIKGNAVIIKNTSGELVRAVGTNLDLTEIRATEAKLAEARVVAVQAQKFDTIGQLTGGVAHDFNNLLAVIMGNLELLEDEIRGDKIDVSEALLLIEASIDATKRGADLTQNMLSYARKARLVPEMLDLNEVVRETEKWMRRTIASRIDIEIVLQAGLWPTMADKSSLQSALVNLIVNARDAFDGSGQVTIETSNVRVDEDYISDRSEDIKAGRYVMLAVSDNGRGIDPEIIDQIFDPFFTTKAVGKGSGLGLSMVHGFVKQSGGAVRVYSEVGSGTSFKMYFPAVATSKLDMTSEDKTALVQPAQDRKGKRILLVEDRVEVIMVLQKTLEGAGFEVVTAPNGDEGYATYIRNQNFDLVITDIVMPGELQGPSMAQKIRGITPRMKFIFLSGYASEATVHGNGLTADDIRLMKPVSRVDLLNAVEKVLSRQINIS